MGESGSRPDSYTGNAGPGAGSCTVGTDGQEDAIPTSRPPALRRYEILAAAVHTRPFARFTARTVIRSVPVWFCANLSTSM